MTKKQEISLYRKMVAKYDRVLASKSKNVLVLDAIRDKRGCPCCVASNRGRFVCGECPARVMGAYCLHQKWWIEMEYAINNDNPIAYRKVVSTRRRFWINKLKRLEVK
jgi:hypothetical protein